MNTRTVNDSIILAGFRFEGPITVRLEHYFNGQQAIRLEAPDEEGDLSPLCTATCNVGKLADGEVTIKDYSENQGVLAWLVKHNIVERTGRDIFSGFVKVEICKLNTEFFNPEAQASTTKESTMDNTQVQARKTVQDALAELFDPFDSDYSTQPDDYINDDDLIELLETGSVEVEVELPDESTRTLQLTLNVQVLPAE